MHVNPLEQVKLLPRVKLDRFLDSSESRPVKSQSSSGAGGRQASAFDLDAECAHGRMALLYWEEEGAPELSCSIAAGDGTPYQRPQVWFQDLSFRWHFIANSFTDYFRLVTAHLGIPQWQHAFTDAGLGPATCHWLAYFCPERLALATEHNPSVRRARQCSKAKLAASARPESRPRGRREQSLATTRRSKAVSCRGSM